MGGFTFDRQPRPKVGPGGYLRPMGDRRFAGRDGRRWEIRVRGQREWLFEPVEDNPGPARAVTPPGYERDPFELSVEELQALLDGAPPPRARPKNSPFLD